MIQRLGPTQLEAIRGLVENAANLSVFLDFDGTLAPIAESPEKAKLDPDVRGLLVRLSERPNVLLAFVSGRTLSDLRTRVDVPRAVYAGNHGLEIEGMAVQFAEPVANSLRKPLASLSRALSTRLANLPGVLVEDKGLTLAVHYRLAAPASYEEIERKVRRVIASGASEFSVKAGNKVWEVLPRTDWDKGEAVCWIESRLAGSGAIPVYIGDDQTDETAFERLPDAITIRVGGGGPSYARYELPGPAEVHGFLEWLDNVAASRLRETTA
jgi:trehalose-phosphatase